MSGLPQDELMDDAARPQIETVAGRAIPGSAQPNSPASDSRARRDLAHAALARPLAVVERVAQVALGGGEAVVALAPAAPAAAPAMAPTAAPKK